MTREQEENKLKADVRGVVSWQFGGVTNLTEEAYNDSLNFISEKVHQKYIDAGYRLVPEPPEDKVKEIVDILDNVIVQARVAGYDKAFEIRRNAYRSILKLQTPELKVLSDRPKIVCLCGSTRFTTEMLITQWNFTKQGHIVLSWCALPNDYYLAAGYDEEYHIGDHEGVKEIVDEVHKRKIDLADEVFVLNIGGYIGDSTTSEIKYALEHNKPVKYLEPEWDYSGKGISS